MALSASVRVGKESCPMAVLLAAIQVNSVRSRWEGKGQGWSETTPVVLLCLWLSMVRMREVREGIV